MSDRDRFDYIESDPYLQQQINALEMELRILRDEKSEWTAAVVRAREIAKNFPNQMTVTNKAEEAVAAAVIFVRDLASLELWQKPSEALMLDAGSKASAALADAPGEKPEDDEEPEAAEPAGPDE